MLLEYLGTSGGRQSACKSRGAKHPADFVCENPQKIGYCDHVLPEKTWSVYDLSSITAVWFLRLRVGLPLDSLQTFAEVVLVGLAVGAIAVLIEKQIQVLYWKVKQWISWAKLSHSGAIIGNEWLKSGSAQESVQVDSTIEHELQNLFDVQIKTQSNLERLLKDQNTVQNRSNRFKRFHTSSMEAWKLVQDLDDLSQKYETLSQKVKNNWDDFPLAERQLIKDKAHQKIDLLYARKLDLLYAKEKDQFTLLKVVFNLAKSAFTNPVASSFSLVAILKFIRSADEPLAELLSEWERARNRLIEAQYRLFDDILDLVERDEPAYQEFLSDSLEELEEKIANSECIQPLKSEEISGWLQELSDSASEEV